jgi:uncharacterized protein
LRNVPHNRPLEVGEPDDDVRHTRRRVLAFSLVGLLFFVIVLAIFEHAAVDHAAITVRHLVGRVRGITVGSFTRPEIFSLTIMGLSAGFLSGILGMGGGVLKIAGLLVLLGQDIFFARAISLITMFFSSASALIHYIRLDLVIWRMVGPMVAAASLTAIVGATIGSQVSGPTLTHLFGIFLLFQGLNTMALIFADPDEQITEEGFASQAGGTGWGLRAVIGGLHGMLCGVLGISGGVIATPMQQVMLHVPVRHAVANTLLVSTIITAIAGTIVVWTGLGRGDFTVDRALVAVLCLGGGALVGAQLGSRLGTRIDPLIVRVLFVVLTFAAGLSILF